MDRTELAWAAGFWDGEGSAYLGAQTGRTTVQPHARVNQSSINGVPEVLEHFARAVGFGEVRGPDLMDGREPLYRWAVSNRRDVERLMELLTPWLGKVKRAQFSEVLGIPDRSASDDFRDRVEWIAWWAGLFDGEGSIYLAKHQSHPGRRVLEAAITQSGREEPEVLIRFRDFAAIGKIYGPYDGGPDRLPVYRWKAHRRNESEAIVRLLGPHLGNVKRVQADDAIRIVAAQPPLPRGNPAWGNRKTHCVRGHDYATARVRPFKSRGKNLEAQRASHQCLACVREDARERRRQKRTAADGRRS